MTFIKVKRRYWIAALVLAAAIAAVVFARGNDDSRLEGAWQQADLKLGRQPVYQDGVEEVSLVLKSDGFNQKEVRPESRRFLLSLDNRTNAKELVLRLTRADGSQVRELRVPGGGGDWSELFDLPAGAYTFTEAGHSKWSCKIILQ